MNYDLIQKYMVHYVTDESYGDYANIHTHGLLENFNHKDLQLVIPYRPNETSDLINEMVDRIDRGEKFEVGRKYSGIIPDRDIEVIEKEESGRTILRILVYDKHNISPLRLMCADYYSRQVFFNPELSYRRYYGLTK